MPSVLTELTGRRSRKTSSSRRCATPLPGDPLTPEQRARLDQMKVPAYSNSWEHAGLLLDRLKREGWGSQLDIGLTIPVYVRLYRLDSETLIKAEGATPAEAITLAFCLAYTPEESKT